MSDKVTFEDVTDPEDLEDRLEDATDLEEKLRILLGDDSDDLSELDFGDSLEDCE